MQCNVMRLDVIMHVCMHACMYIYIYIHVYVIDGYSSTNKIKPELIHPYIAGFIILRNHKPWTKAVTNDQTTDHAIAGKVLNSISVDISI